VVQPPGAATGWWAGAPSLLYDGGIVYLSYRLRRPRALGRGYETRIATSTDRMAFHDVWRMTAADLASPSIERCALAKGPEGTFRLYVSYVDGGDSRWRIDMLEAPTCEELDPRRRRPALVAEEIGVAGVKDPCLLELGGELYMFVSCAVQASGTPAELHREGDAFASGMVRSATGVATSADGLDWRWSGIVLAPPEAGWDAYETRISCVLPDNGRYLAFYDGIRSAAQNYEERTGVAESTDLRTWRRLSVARPLFGSPVGSGSLRYVAVLELLSDTVFCAEVCRRDGSHGLCRFEAPLDLRRL
jgi:hypothetical protein